jgi:predicted ATP-grasp superfamily ATP-dependent carboligase
MQDQEKTHSTDAEEPGEPSNRVPLCACVQDPYADLPTKLRPRPVEKLDDLRKVTCPGCGLVYWTNRKPDLCIECEKKGVHVPETKVSSEG